jgi:hypothetical protein
MILIFSDHALGLQTPFGEIEAIDSHTHVFPDALFDHIWRYFEAHYWPVNYKLYGPQIAEFYETMGFSHYTTLNYAHKENISDGMNQFTMEYHRQFPQSIPLGTVHPGDSNLLNDAETALTSYSLKGFKFQLLVTNFYIYDPRLIPVYDLVKREDKVLVFHAGTGPAANRYVGFRHFQKFIEKYLDIRVQVAHLGSFEYKPFLDLLKVYPNLYFDTAMILVNHNLFPSNFDLPYEALIENEDRILFGSDFPNIPYDFSESYRFLFSLNFPKSFYEKIFALNAKRFYDL